MEGGKKEKGPSRRGAGQRKNPTRNKKQHQKQAGELSSKDEASQNPAKKCLKATTQTPFDGIAGSFSIFDDKFFAKNVLRKGLLHGHVVKEAPFLKVATQALDE